MNKEEFLKKLRKKISILEDSEIDDIISEYEGYIDEKVNNGLTEEDAVKELGNFNEIVSDLLSAYKIKNNEKEENTFEKIISSINNVLDTFTSFISNKSGRDILKILIEIIIILLLISLLKIPFTIIKDLVNNIFIELTNPISNIFSAIWAFIIDLSYVIISIVFFIKVIEQRYFKNISENIVTNKENDKKEELSPKSETIKEMPKEYKQGFISTVTNLCIIILKLIILMFLIGIICYIIGITFILGLMIYLIIRGVTYFGILLFIISMLLGGILLLEIGFNFIFNKKIKPKVFLSKLIFILLLTGLGLTFSTIEIANTEIIYNNYLQNTKSVIKEIPMENNLTLYNYDKIIIDNNLNNTVKIEYKYPDINNNNIEIELNNCGVGYCLNTNTNHISWNKKLLDIIIANLKDKKIYTYEYNIEKIVYISESNYEKLNKNNQSQNTKTTKRILKLHKIENKDLNYVNLNLENLETKEIATLEIPKFMISNLKENQAYTFTFEVNNYGYNDTLKDLFLNSKVINIQ